MLNADRRVVLLKTHWIPSAEERSTHNRGRHTVRVLQAPQKPLVAVTVGESEPSIVRQAVAGRALFQFFGAFVVLSATAVGFGESSEVVVVFRSRPGAAPLGSWRGRERGNDQLW